MLTPNEIDQLAEAIAGRLTGNRIEADSLLDVHQAAKLLGCSTATIERLVRGGSIPSIKVGRLRRFSKSDLLNQKKGGTDE